MGETRQAELMMDVEIITKGGGYEPGGGYFLKFRQGVRPCGRILAPILMTVGDPVESLSCSMGRRLSFTWSR